METILSLKSILMHRDGLSHEDADKAIAEAKWRVANGADPEEVLEEDFGLEPDYFFDLV